MPSTDFDEDFPSLRARVVVPYGPDLSDEGIRNALQLLSEAVNETLQGTQLQVQMIGTTDEMERDQADAIQDVLAARGVPVWILDCPS